MNLNNQNINTQTGQKIVTVIMPIRNEADHIQASLSAVLNQTYASNLVEIIVVDGESNDSTVDIVKTIQSRHSNIRFLNNPKKVVPAALNLGIQNATGEIIIRVDGHTIIDSTYIQECVDALERTGADNVGGKMVGCGQTPFGEAVALATSHPFGIGNSRFHYSDREEAVDSVYLGAWHKKVFIKAGLFNEEMVRDQDDEFNYRLRKLGGKIMLIPQIKSSYTVRSSARKLWKQYFEYGFWKVRVFSLHPGQMSYRHFIPSLFVVGTAFLIFLSLFSRIARKGMGLMFALYAGGNILASVSISKKNGCQYLKSLPIVFSILHVAYGTGFLAGVYQFFLRGNKKDIRL